MYDRHAISSPKLLRLLIVVDRGCVLYGMCQMA